MNPAKSLKPHSFFHTHKLTSLNKGRWHFSLCTRVDSQIKQVYIRCEPDNEELLVEMRLHKSSEQLIEWRGSIEACLHQDCTLYLFKAFTESDQYWLANDGVHPWLPAQERHFRVNAKEQPPAWLAQQVFYQIFPDRFANGQPELNVKTGEYAYQNGKCKIVQKKWGQPVAACHSKKAAFEFYGGDLQGIINKLDYLSELGISALYLNPIFSSPSNHKYDTTDYMNVDPHLGGNQKLAELSKKVHQADMRIILDLVVNHTSAEHPWLDRYEVGDGTGAYANEDSPYRAYYNFDANGHYWNWKGIESLPKLDLSYEPLQQYLYKGKASVMRHWLQAPYYIDGWRFDVAHMLGDGNSAKNNHLRFTEFRQATHQATHKEGKQPYILGEHFFEATAWLQGDQEDGAMNYYGFLRPLRAFLAGSDITNRDLNIDASLFSQWLEASRGAIPFANQLAQYNLLNSHDTPRFITVLAGDKQKLSLAVVLLFTYIGVPSIYYGDEIGLPGGDDPDCRRCFPWDEQDWDLELLSLYRRMIKLRQKTPCLSSGDMQTLYARGDCFAFVRWLPTSHLIVVINRGDACTLDLDLSLLPELYKQYMEVESATQFTCDGHMLTLEIESCGYLLLALPT